ncbi:hypothetical protein [Hoeflea sp. TYP-13]|uniref:hypothetical protein n=1 Tax=Hoeflea sp. TYP-13 TaxID=3230023 RepID=UPI0034C5B760
MGHGSRLVRSADVRSPLRLPTFVLDYGKNLCNAIHTGRIDGSLAEEFLLAANRESAVCKFPLAAYESNAHDRDIMEAEP